MSDIKQKISDLIAASKVVLFMKGTPEAPMCGFSATVAQVLKVMKVEFDSVDVLQDPEIRQGIKDYSNWPTIPQLYINQEFIGGCDIVKEAYQNGELEALLQTKA